jgi:hypothetical protein
MHTILKRSCSGGGIEAREVKKVNVVYDPNYVLANG